MADATINYQYVVPMGNFKLEIINATVTDNDYITSKLANPQFLAYRWVSSSSSGSLSADFVDTLSTNKKIQETAPLSGHTVTYILVGW